MTKHTLRHHLAGWLLIGMVVGLLLSGCNANASTTVQKSSTPTPIPTPAINASIANNGDMQLQTYQQWISLLTQYKGDATTYQKQYIADQQALKNATTDAAYNSALKTLSDQINAIKMPALKTEAQTLHTTLENEVSAWGAQHTYHDTYDGNTYQFGFEYGDPGVVGDDVNAIDTDQTPKDLQQTIEDFNTYLTNFQAMQDDAKDTTPYNQVHKTDTELMQKYGDMQGKVVVVSLYEQAMRIYNNGQLVNSFQVTTGTPDHPSLPGEWWSEVKQSPTTFTSFLPPGAPGYYPPTYIHYAIQYHSLGYFIHDSWWRVTYGPDTQFPHPDPSGNESATEGSHGCINLSLDNATWVYSYIDLNDPILVY
jgi:hypothetical protein